MKPRLSLKGRGVQLLAQREHSRIELHRKLLKHARADLAAERARDARETPRGSFAHDVGQASAPMADVEPEVEVEAEAEASPDLVADVDAVIAWLESKGFFNESRFVESRVNARAPRFGTQRIRQELAQHGVSLSPDELQALKDSEFERARAVWERKFGQPPADMAERARQLRFMAARGFSHEVVRRVMHRSEAG